MTTQTRPLEQQRREQRWRWSVLMEAMRVSVKIAAKAYGRGDKAAWKYNMKLAEDFQQQAREVAALRLSITARATKAEANSSCPASGSASLNRGPKTHALKTWPAFYEAVERGWKPFEARKADRDFQVGDTLWLLEWNPETQRYTGNDCERLVTYILRGPAFGVEAGWVVLGVATPNAKLCERGEGT